MTEKRSRSLRWLVSLLTGAYALGLMVFLVLRLIFGDSFWWLAFFGNFTPLYFVPLIVLLPLALVVRARRGVLLMLPITLLGLIWFGRLYLPKAHAEAGDSPTLRIVSFNVWEGNQNQSAAETWLRDQNADVVITVESSAAWSEHVLALTDAYPEQSHAVASSESASSNLLSRHPFLSAEQIDLGDGQMPQQRVVIEIGGQQVAIYGVHLFLPQGDSARLRRFARFASSEFLRYDQSIRDGQIRHLLDVIRTEPLPYIVAGDFNMSDQSTPYASLAAVMGDSFREAGIGLGASWPAAQAFGLPSLLPPLVRIDYIWHSAQFRTVAASQGPYLGSDHLPLLATLALE